MLKDPLDYVDGVISGNRRFLAKAITLIESSLSVHRKVGRVVVDRLLPNSGNAIRLGITGVPGVGKSTFIEALGSMLVKDGYNLAVLAVDPSSVVSGGSIMADKTRMERLSAHPNAFIRPSPSGGTLGGVTRVTRETMVLCEAAGFDVVIVETVGVGQSEISVASMVDFFLVLMLAGAGDELQGIKRGVLEIADALAINKADGENMLKAKQAKTQYEAALQMFRPASTVWSPPVMLCSSVSSLGLKDIWKRILVHRKKLSDTGEFFDKRKKQAVKWMWDNIKESFIDCFLENRNGENDFSKVTEAVENGKISPGKGAEMLFSLLTR